MTKPVGDVFYNDFDKLTSDLDTKTDANMESINKDINGFMESIDMSYGKNLNVRIPADLYYWIDDYSFKLSAIMRKRINRGHVTRKALEIMRKIVEESNDQN